MMKIAVLIWSILAVTFAGMLIIVVLLAPGLNTLDWRAIPIAAAIGVLLAIPAALFVAKRIYAMTAPREIKEP